METVKGIPIEGEVTVTVTVETTIGNFTKKTFIPRIHMFAPRNADTLSYSAGKAALEAYQKIIWNKMLADGYDMKLKENYRIYRATLDGGIIHFATKEELGNAD